jgi:hypothetical protein
MSRNLGSSSPRSDELSSPAESWSLEGGVILGLRLGAGGLGFRPAEAAAPSKLASDLRGGGRAGSSPLIDETEARFAPVELNARGVDCDLGSSFRAGCSDVSPVDDDTVGVCVAEVDRLSGGVLTFLSVVTRTGCERYSFR